MGAALILLLATLQAQDPVQVRARLNDEQIEAGQTTVLRVDVETEGERAQIQRFRSLPPGLELQGTRDYDQRQFSIPGGTRRFVSREFVLRARAAGRYRIPQVEVIVAGQTYTTRSLLLTVVGSSSPPEGAVGDDGSGVALRAWLDADTVYVGEQVTLEAEAMFSQGARLRLRRAPEYEPPSPSGFWIHDLPDRRRPTTRVVGGESYEVQQFRRLLFPLSPGEYEVPPARLEYEMRRGLLYAPETLELTSEPLPLVVLPVPGGRPPGFTGAVGDYALRAWLEPARVPAGEAAVLTVEVEGTGNVKALPPPELPALQGIDTFPPSEEAETGIEGSHMQGVKRFSWVLIPRQAGDLEIPEIRYAFFDPAAEAFGTAMAGPITLSVEPGGGGSDDIAPAPMLRYLRSEPGGGDPLGWVRSGWFAAAQALPLLLLAAGFWRGRARSGLARPASVRALRRRRTARLRELEDRAAGTDPALLGDAETFAREWLAERLATTANSATRPAAMTAAGVEEDTAAALTAVLDRLAAARYAPTPPGPEARRDLVRALGRILDRVDRQARAPRAAPDTTAARDAATARTLLALLLVPMVAADPATGHAGQPAEAAGTARTTFEDGIRAYDAERYMAAAEAFDRYVADRPADPAGWYNLGTAYHRAGYPGYAVWAWLKVPALDPRDADARHNLRVAGVAPELVARVAPPLPLRTSELLLMAAASWLATGLAGAVWLARRRAASTAAATAAATAFLLALGMAGAAWASTRTPDTLIVLESATLRAGPTLRGGGVVELEPGTGLVPVERRDDWVRARTLRGDEGWIEADMTGRI